MLEILLIILLGMKLSSMAKERGKSGTLGLAALAVPGVGWTIALLSGVAIMLGTGTRDIMSSPYFILAIVLMYGAEGAIAWGLYRWVKNMPRVGAVGYAGAAAYPGAAAGGGGVPMGLQPATVPSLGPRPSADMDLAGYCAECGRQVWLNGDCSCPAGHPMTSVSGMYWAPTAVEQ